MIGFWILRRVINCKFVLLAMLPQSHFILGLIGSLVLYFGFDVSLLYVIVFLVASVGIDVDHYLYYVWRKKDWSLKNAVVWFMYKKRIMDAMDFRDRKNFYKGFCFLHGIEFIVLFGLLGFFVWDIFYFVGLGFLFHLILDYIRQVKNKDRFDKFSVVWDYFKYKKLAFAEEIEGLGEMAIGLKK